MSRGVRGFVLAVVAAARALDASAVPPLEVSAEVAFGDAVHVVVQVANGEGEALHTLVPEVRYRLTERTGSAVDLAAGARHAWQVDFPAPHGPGGDALIVLLRWADPGGTHRSWPYVRLVETPGLLPTEAQMIVEPKSTVGYEEADVRITNATASPLRGRLVAVLPEECFTTPVAQPVDVPPRDTLAVPITVQGEGPPGATYPLYAILQFEQGGIPRAIVGRTILGIGSSPDRSTLRPLTVGTLVLLLAVTVVLLANRRVARRLRQVDGQHDAQ